MEIRNYDDFMLMFLSSRGLFRSQNGKFFARCLNISLEKVLNRHIMLIFRFIILFWVTSRIG